MPSDSNDRKPAATTWTSRVVNGELRDVKLDPSTGQPVAVATWLAPLHNVGKGDRCANCGGRRVRPDGPITAFGDGIRDVSPQCEACGLNVMEDRNLHEDIMRRLGSSGFLDASERAAQRGQRVLALKMASAELAFGQDRHGARKQRLRLLGELGHPELVLEESDLWLRSKAAAPEVAVAVAEALLRISHPAEAWAALDEALRLRPDHVELRLTRSRMLRLANRTDEALQDLLHVLRPEKPDQLPLILRQLEKLNQRALDEADPGWVLRAIDKAAPHSHRHAPTCAQRARAEEALGQLSSARRWWIRTLHLDPQHPEAEAELRRIDELMGLATVPEY